MQVAAVRSIALAGALALTTVAAQAQQIRLMTGPQGGAWYPLGGAIANIAGKSGAKVQVLPGAGIANVKAVEAGKADMGFGNSISTVDGVAGRAPFDAPTKNVCNVALLYPQYLQIIANADAGINSLGDLKGRSLAVQPRGNTAEFISAQALQVYGLKYQDMSRVSYVSYTDAVSLMKDNNAQVFTLGTTLPASSVMDLAAARDIRVIGIPDDKFQAMRKLNPGYTKLTIPAGSYPKQAQDVQTVGYATHLIAIAKAVQGATPKVMAEDIGVPLHKGAQRFYKEIGAL